MVSIKIAQTSLAHLLVMANVGYAQIMIILIRTGIAQTLVLKICFLNLAE